MLGESLVIKKSAEVAIHANEVAELGAVKPHGFGSLIKKHYFSETMQPRFDNLYLTEFPRMNTRPNLFGFRDVKEDLYFSLRYNDISKECSEFLCDYGITPWEWQEADSNRRMEMLGTVTEILGKELNLPEEWGKGIKPIATSGESYIAQASCKVRVLNNGGVDIVGIPTLSVNMERLTDDYLEVMATIYHEMIHMKQYASIDCVAPGETIDSRGLDLINDLKTNSGTPKSRASYLYSPYEAEAWAQEAYFKKMLSAVLLDSYDELMFNNKFKSLVNVHKEVKALRHISTINEGLEREIYPGTNVEYKKHTFMLNGEKVEGVFPEFESKFNTFLPENLQNASDTEQFKYCTQKLAQRIENDPCFAAQFTLRQIEQIKNGEPRISGLTWHHNEVPGKMQLVNADIHSTCRHTGGKSIWAGGADCR